MSWQILVQALGILPAVLPLLSDHREKRLALDIESTMVTHINSEAQKQGDRQPQRTASSSQ